MVTVAVISLSSKYFLPAWKQLKKKLLGVHSSLSLNPSFFPVSHTYPLSFHYIASLPYFFFCLCPSASLSPYLKVTEWFHSTAQSRKRPWVTHSLLNSVCGCLISFNSLIFSFAGGSCGVKASVFSDVVVTFTTDLVITLAQQKGVLLGNFSEAWLDCFVECTALWWCAMKMRQPHGREDVCLHDLHVWAKKCTHRVYVCIYVPACLYPSKARGLIKSTACKAAPLQSVI